MTRRAAIRGLGALAIAALGLVVALTGSSSQTSVDGKGNRVDFRPLAPGAASRTSVAPTRTGVRIKHGPRVVPAAFNGSVQILPLIASSPAASERVEPEREFGTLAQKAPVPGAGVPTKSVPPERSTAAPDPTVSFDGLDKTTWGAGFPPDTVGDVGPNHFIQAVNTSIGIFSKTGTQLAAFTFDTLWALAATGTACDADNAGDPTVIYDPLGDRWIVADFAFAGSGTATPYFECIAVSKTADPVHGGWFLYAIRTDDVGHPFLSDYPKMGIWPDGLYMTANEFCFAPTPGCASVGTYKEVRVWAFNRDDLESGVAPRNVVVDLGDTTVFGLMPSNMRTATGIPPAGRENLLVSESATLFAFEVWKFHVDYSDAGSTFSNSPTNVSQTAYSVALSTVPTPGNSLDTLRERMMMQSQYTSIGGVESLWVNHTVGCCGASAPAGIQWAQINVTGGTINTTPIQQQLYPAVNDGLSRWMGSLAVDKKGDMALGYSVANAATNADIRYAGRLAGDPLNTLAQTETTMLPGVARGSQTAICGDSACTRWGDYSAMTIDPDGCRFWYTQEYYATTGSNWQTRIGSFSFPACAKTSQAITFGVLADKIFGDADFAVSALASSGFAVSFGATGDCTIAGSTVHLTGAGSCTVAASQAGDATFSAAPDVGRTFAIAKANQAIAFGTVAAKAFGDPDFAVAASASSGLAVSLAASGNCTISGARVHITGAGSCTITASQVGNANVNAALDVAQTFAIGKASQTISFAQPPVKTLGARDFSVSATATSGLPVLFAAGGSCSVSGTTVHLKSAGTCTLTASQPGDANYNAANSVARAFKVLQPPCSVPRVAGKKLAAAKSSIKAKHCRTGTVGFAYSTKIAKGRVVSQNRRAGQVLAPGAKINLVVSRGRRP